MATTHMEFPSGVELAPPLLKAVHELFSAPLDSPGMLKEELDEYLCHARAALPRGSRQLGLAESLTSRCLELVTWLGPKAPEGQRRLAEAAVRYLMATDDAQPDFETATGLEDDAQVFNAIAAYLGRSDLAVTL